MTQHRIFIAINLPDSVKKNLSAQQLKWAELPCRWTRKENLHITLAFLGYLNDEELVELCKITREIASRHDPVMIKLNKIIYAPKNQPPRMIWVEGEENQELEKLQKDLANSLPVEKEKENKQYVPHITLGKIKQMEFKIIEPEERPQIDESISLSFEASSIEIMESELKRGGPEYELVESFPLSSSSIC
jgi:RNA 2',3'-cyclic 3'-phosphodiesterase